MDGDIEREVLGARNGSKGPGDRNRGEFARGMNVVNLDSRHDGKPHPEDKLGIERMACALGYLDGRKVFKTLQITPNPLGKDTRKLQFGVGPRRGSGERVER